MCFRALTSGTIAEPIAKQRLDSGEKENVASDSAMGNSDEVRTQNNSWQHNSCNDVCRFQLKAKDSEINELKSRFLRHRQILMTNYQQAESEIRRIDEIHHDSISRVLQVRTI